MLISLIQDTGTSDRLTMDWILGSLMVTSTPSALLRLCCLEELQYAGQMGEARGAFVPYKFCPQCPKKYVRKCNLERHMLTHTGQRPYRCDQCTKAYTDPSHLRAHKMTHTGKWPYKCHLCTMGCLREKDLARHLRTHKRRGFHM